MSYALGTMATLREPYLVRRHLGLAPNPSTFGDFKAGVCRPELMAMFKEAIRNIWNDTKEQKLTQLIFCDMSTPKGDGSFNVYDDIRTKLLNAGVPEQEIEFIHNADTENKKAELFSKVRSGQVRVLLGSTAKMGAGTNVQTLLVAVHHLDVGWRPSDMTQRNGRIIRQGNQNKQVYVYNYVTESTFDAYLYQTLENKQKFISQIMTSKSPIQPLRSRLCSAGTDLHDRQKPHTALLRTDYTA